LGITIACHCNLFSTLASFETGDVAPDSFPNNNMNKGRASFGTGDVALASFPNNYMNKGRWTQDEHKVFMQEYEKYGNNCMQITKVLSMQTPAQIKRKLNVFSNKI
jgi:hypothetical protein